MLTDLHSLKNSTGIFSALSRTNEKVNGRSLNEAKKYFEDVIESTVTPKDEVIAMITYAAFLTHNHQYEAALECYESAFKVAQERMAFDKSNATNQRTGVRLTVYILLHYLNVFFTINKSISGQSDTIVEHVQDIATIALTTAYTSDEIDMINWCNKLLYSVQGPSNAKAIASLAYQQVKTKADSTDSLYIFEYYAFVLTQQGNKKEAIQVLKEALSFAKNRTKLNQNQITRISINLANSFAESNCEEALQIINQVTSVQSKTLVNALLCKANIEFIANSWQEAISTLKQAVELAEKSNNLDTQVYGDLILASILTEQGNYQDAIFYASDAAKIANRLDCDDETISFIHNVEYNIETKMTNLF